MAVIWRTPEGEKIYVTPTGWPLTKKAHQLADEFDAILIKKMKESRELLKRMGYFEMKNKLQKHHLLGETLQFLDDLELLPKCDPDHENIWRALYDYAPDLAPKKIPTDEARIAGKRNFFLNSYRLGQLSLDTLNQIGTWSNWNDIYMVFASNPKLWDDWERLLNWILMKSKKTNKIERSTLRETLKIFRKILGKRTKVKRDTTVLTDSELLELLESKISKNN